MSSSEESSPLDKLYKGWMTGFTYQAARDLYFPQGSLRDLSQIDESERQKLLGVLETYLNLVEDWKAADSAPMTAGLMSMINDVLQKSSAATTLNNFDTWYSELFGAVRAKMPYASYAADFASALSELGHLQPSGKATSLVSRLSQALKNLKSTIPIDSHEVVKECLDRLRKAVDRGDLKIARYAKTMQPDISSLILGTRSPDSFLESLDRVKTTILLGLVGIALLVPVAIAVDFTKYILPYLGLQQANLNDVSSTIAVLTPVLTALGLTASLVAKKVWNLLKFLEQKGTVHYARQEILRAANLA